MPFIGQQPLTGAYSKLDAITASATATYNLQLGGSAYSPASANHLLVSLNGVMQAPQDSFTVSGSQITFASALTSSDNIDFIMALGDVLNIGTPSDGSVNTSQLANSAVTDAKISGMAASKLTGAMPALDGSALTGVSSGFKSMQVFTSSGTYTKPSGINTIKVIVTGGGGQGGGYGAANDYGAGGGAGGTAIEVIDVSSLGSTVAVTVGAGGTGANATSDGNTGSTSSFGSYCSATGGVGGRHGNRGSVYGGHGGAGAGGNINLNGGQGNNGVDNDYVPGGTNYRGTWGLGGASYWGGGGRGAVFNIGAQGGASYGSGGGGGSPGAGTGGAGKVGIVVVEEYA